MSMNIMNFRALCLLRVMLFEFVEKLPKLLIYLYNKSIDALYNNNYVTDINETYSRTL